MEDIIETLKSFNAKVERLERSGFSRRFSDEVPEVMAKFKTLHVENLGEGQLVLSGEVESWVADYNEDEVDAVVLTYRMLTQDNDRVSLRSLSRIYNADWFPEEGMLRFNEARDEVNGYLDSLCTLSFPKGGITIRKVMDIIIYGGLAHTTLKKERIFNSWMASGVGGFLQVEFVAALKFMLSCFTYFRELNQITIQLLEEHMRAESGQPVVEAKQ